MPSSTTKGATCGGGYHWYHWSVQGLASDIAHGGLSLMECLVLAMKMKRVERNTQ
jgi:hypothetical protein